MAKRIREKAAARRESADKRPRAVAKYVRISPDKVRIVLDIIRGAKYTDAVAILKNTRKAACEPLLKVLNSAAANAENNFSMNRDALYVAQALVSPGPTLKRVMPRAQGRAFRINKRTSHITVVLKEKE